MHRTYVGIDDEHPPPNSTMHTALSNATQALEFNPSVEHLSLVRSGGTHELVD
jgi:hypothetical protein